MREMLTYDQTLLDSLCYTFTVNEDHFGKVTEVELCPNGRNIELTTNNREEYIKLFINYKFIKQCQT